MGVDHVVAVILKVDRQADLFKLVAVGVRHIHGDCRQQAGKQARAVVEHEASGARKLKAGTMHPAGKRTPLGCTRAQSGRQGGWASPPWGQGSSSRCFSRAWRRVGPHPHHPRPSTRHPPIHARLSVLPLPPVRHTHLCAR